MQAVVPTTTSTKALFLCLNHQPPHISLIFFSSPSLPLSLSVRKTFITVHNKGIDSIILSSFMGSFWPILAMLMIFFMAYQSSSALASAATRKVSTISAAPAVLPSAPLFSPALSPDITPLFPSPGGVTLPPSESSLPIIPSSQTPNPDAMAPGHDIAFPPSGSLPPSSSVSAASSGRPLNLLLLLALAAVCIMQLPGM